MAEPRVLAIIPARGGSKRLPRKNILPLAGKPLIAWSIEAALKSGVVDDVVVTSDSDEILATALPYGVKQQRRAAALASDTASSIDVVLDAIQREEAAGAHYDHVILLQPTSPLRNAADIAAAYARFAAGPGCSLVSVCELDHPLEWCGTITPQGMLTGLDLAPNTRSQDYAPRCRLNGAIYISTVQALRARRSFFGDPLLAYPMPRSRSFDIDTDLDFIVCDALARNPVS